MAVVLISGGTGLIGRALSRSLIEKGHEVRVLSRNPKPSSLIKYYYWNVEKAEIDEIAFEGITHLVHLAGEGIAEERWSERRKQQIVDSRAKSMKLLESVLLKINVRLQSFVGASAIGFYGMRTTDKIFNESDSGTRDFLSETCQLWEKAYSGAQEFAEKTCVIRTGIVLSPEGGALSKLLAVFKLGLGSAVGSGKHYMPWIHISDLVGVYEAGLFNPTFSGCYNAVTSEHVNNHNFSKALAKALHKPFFMPKVPAFVLKVIYGGMAEMMLTGSRISNKRLLDSGFIFKFSELDKALENVTNVK